MSEKQSMATTVSQVGRVEANLQGQDEYPGQVVCKVFEEHTWERTGRGLRPKYRYEPLSESSIRLVKIELMFLDNAFLTTEALEIGISFETMTLAEAESASYTAISYTWGPATDMEAVHCREGALLVTPNLYDAMRVFADSGKTLFWIDQLSINQSDAAEKSSQIKQMGRIFRSAERVAIWFSKELFEDEEIGKNLDPLCGFCVDQFFWINRHNSTSSFAAWEETTYPEYQEMIKSWVPPQCWQSAAKLFSHPYFRRVWVIQEVTMANLVEAYFGRRAFPWRNLSMVVIFLQRARIPRALVPPILTRPQIEAAERLVTMESTTSEDENRSTDLKGKVTLLDLIIHTSGCLATDERDKVYGLLGFLDPGHNCIAQSVEPDYSLNFNNLIHEVGRQSMLISQRLIHLAYCHPYLSDEYPSWLTDISELDYDKVMPYGLHDHAALFNAGGDLPASVTSIPDNTRQLSIEVIRLGSTSIPGPSPTYSLRKRRASMRVEDFDIQVHRNDFYEVLDLLRKCFSLMSQCLPSSHDNWEHFIRTIACDISTNNPSQQISLEEYYDLESWIVLGIFDIGRDRSRISGSAEGMDNDLVGTEHNEPGATEDDGITSKTLNKVIETKATECLARILDGLFDEDKAEDDETEKDEAGQVERERYKTEQDETKQDETEKDNNDKPLEKNEKQEEATGMEHEQTNDYFYTGSSLTQIGLINTYLSHPGGKGDDEERESSRQAWAQRLKEIHGSIQRADMNPNGQKAGDIEPWLWRTFRAVKTLTSVFRRLECLRFCIGTLSTPLSSSGERFLAWVPEEACSTDEIVLIRGFTFPMLVRPQEDGSYRFMGISYVFGFMDGALWEDDAVASERIVVS